MADIAANSEIHPMNHRKVVIGGAQLEIMPDPFSSDTIVLQDLQSMARGSGRAALKYICGLADHYDLSIKLCAKGYAHTPTVDLIILYMCNGFVSEDFSEFYIDDVDDGVDMIRFAHAKTLDLGPPLARTPENTRLASLGVNAATGVIEQEFADMIKRSGIRIVADLAPRLYGYFARKGSGGALREWIEVISEATSQNVYRYVGNCTSRHCAPYLEDMMDEAKEISYKTLVGEVGRALVAETFPDFDWSARPKYLTMSNDGVISYFKSTYRGHPCYYIRESGIEYIFSKADFDSETSDLPGEITYITASGQTTEDASRSLFRVDRRGDRAEVSQSAAATVAAAFTLMVMLKRDGVAIVVEDGEEVPVEKFMDWLNTVQSRDAPGLSEKQVVIRKPAAMNESVEEYLPATPKNIEKAKAFVLAKWKERAEERGHAEPEDLSSSCKFSSLFAHRIFGGKLQGNYDHQYVVVDGEIVDLNVDAKDVRDLMDDGIDPHEHDSDFWGNEDHLESLASCDARVYKWVQEFNALNPSDHIDKGPSK